MSIEVRLGMNNTRRDGRFYEILSRTFYTRVFLHTLRRKIIFSSREIFVVFHFADKLT